MQQKPRWDDNNKICAECGIYGQDCNETQNAKDCGHYKKAGRLKDSIIGCEHVMHHDQDGERVLCGEIGVAITPTQPCGRMIQCKKHLAQTVFCCGEIPGTEYF